MMKLKTIIVDDEPLARECLRFLLKKDREIGSILEFSNGSGAYEYLKNHNCDLMFLDIQMPEMNGLDLLKKIDSTAYSAVIFVTAYDEYAIDAFKVHALDYLLKPFSDEQFMSSLTKAKEIINYKRIGNLNQKISTMIKEYNHPHSKAAKIIKQMNAKSDYLERIPITINGHIFIIKIEDIDYIEAADYYAKIHTGSKSYLYRETMKNLEGRLDPSKFVRVHRSAIVNIDRISELEPYFNGEYFVVLTNGIKIKMSRSYRKEVKKILNFNI